MDAERPSLGELGLGSAKASVGISVTITTK